MYLFSFYLIDGHKKGKFKSLCCIPYFLIVIFVVCCVGAGVALLVKFPPNSQKTSIAVDSTLISIAVILTLTLVGNIYTWAQTFMALISSQKRRVLKAADQVSFVEMNLLKKVVGQHKTSANYI